MDELITLIDCVCRTLEGVTITATEDNCDRMLGSIRALETLRSKLAAMPTLANGKDGGENGR